MKVLVTGANGFVGRNIVPYLRKMGHVILTTDLDSGGVRGDITDKGFVLQTLMRHDFDSIVHLSAVADVRRCIEDAHRCYEVNSFGTLNLLELAIRKRVRRFIYSSSANVYGVPLELPVHETTPFNPRTPYDDSKVISENLIRSYGKHKGLRFVILRSWKLFGGYDIPTTAVSRFILACLRGNRIELYNGGKDTTDPYHIENYCMAIQLCLEKDEAVGQAFNVGTGNEVSIRQLAELIKSLTKSGSEVVDLPPRSVAESQPMRSYPSIDKIRKTLGYKPMIGIEEGLRRTIRYHIDHPNS